MKHKTHPVLRAEGVVVGKCQLEALLRMQPLQRDVFLEQEIVYEEKWWKRGDLDGGGVIWMEEA